MKRIENIAIIGAGALGVMYGRQLTEKLGRDNVCFVADRRRIASYETQGVFCNEERCDFRWVDGNRPDQTYDFVMFAVKYTAMEAAVEMARGICREDTIFLSVLNGIESERVIGDALGADHLLYCVVHGMDATRSGSHIRYQNMGYIVFGDKKNRRTEDVEAVADLFDRAGIACQIPGDIQQKMWSKLMLNTGVNQVAAIFGVGYGGILKEGAARKMMIDAMKEVQVVAACEGVVLTDRDVEQWIAVLDGLDPEGLPSLYQDILAKRPTEVELFSGTVRKLGEKYGVPTLVNDHLYEEIKRLEG
ncbi:MAG: ketopantoate reductase family protein [Peptococcaceae bacterium]|nr:ketopantoate reductase family protein [Peptococcaceae bacterium]